MATSNVSFEQLKSMVVFAQVVEQGSLSAAARQMGLSRAVVSYHLKKLESHLDVKLLHRSTRSINLTEAGETYYDRCRNIAEQAQAANQIIENLKEEPIGLVKITSSVNVGLQSIVPALNHFKNLYPNIELDLMLTDEVVNIVQEGIDLAIRGAPLINSGLQASKLCTLSLCLCASPEYLEKHGIPLTPADLNNHEWIVYKLRQRKLTLSKGKHSHEVNIQGAISTNNAAARTAFVEGGHGIGCIPLYDALPKIKKGTLIPFMEDYSLPGIELYGVFSQGGTQSKKLRVILDFLKNYFSKCTINH